MRCSCCSHQTKNRPLRRYSYKGEGKREIKGDLPAGSVKVFDTSVVVVAADEVLKLGEPCLLLSVELVNLGWGSPALHF